MKDTDEMLEAILQELACIKKNQEAMQSEILELRRDKRVLRRDIAHVDNRLARFCADTGDALEIVVDYVQAQAAKAASDSVSAEKQRRSTS